MSAEQPCPTGCGRQHREGQLMCRTCWFEVPKELRNAVNSTWRKAKASDWDLAAVRAWKAAREAALASVK